MCWNWDWKYHQQLESASTCWNLHQRVGIMIEMCIHNWKWHQLLECGWKLHQQLVCGINLLECSIVAIWKWHQIVGMWHQHLEGASNVGSGLETDLRGIKSWLLTPCWYCYCEEAMRTHLTQSTHLFALWSMCYLPEWDMVNNNNKYTHDINGDINGMLTQTIQKHWQR